MKKRSIDMHMQVAQADRPKGNWVAGLGFVWMPRRRGEGKQALFEKSGGNKIVAAMKIHHQ
jgi:hypothetical protein